MSIKDYDEFGTATYEGREYVLCEDIEVGPGRGGSGGGIAHAVSVRARPNAEGTYKCVILHFDQTVEEWEAAGEENIACDLEDLGERFDPESGEILDAE